MSLVYVDSDLSWFNKFNKFYTLIRSAYSSFFTLHSLQNNSSRPVFPFPPSSFVVWEDRSSWFYMFLTSHVTPWLHRIWSFEIGSGCVTSRSICCHDSRQGSIDTERCDTFEPLVCYAIGKPLPEFLRCVSDSFDAPQDSRHPRESPARYLSEECRWVRYRIT